MTEIITKEKDIVTVSYSSEQTFNLKEMKEERARLENEISAFREPTNEELIELGKNTYKSAPSPLDVLKEKLLSLDEQITIFENVKEV